MVEAFNADLLYLLPFVAIGFCAQAIDGALGMAFGVIVNIILVGFLGIAPATASTQVHIVKCFTTAASGASHFYLGNFDKQLFFRLLIPGAIGGIAGAFLLSYVPSKIIAPFVLVYLSAIGLWILVRGLISSPKIRPPKYVSSIGATGGFLDSIGGGGWGPVATSNLLVQGAEPRTVIGTVNSAEFFLTILISATFIVNLGFGDILGPTIGLMIGGVFAAPFGAIVAKYLPKRLMFILVGIVLTLTSILAIYKSVSD